MDQVARDSATQAHSKIDSHTKVTELQLADLGAKFDDMRSQNRWFIGIVVMLFISTLTWSLAQQYNANEAQKKDLQQQVELLKAQTAAASATSAAQAAGATLGTAQGGNLTGVSPGNRTQN